MKIRLLFLFLIVYALFLPQGVSAQTTDTGQQPSLVLPGTQATITPQQVRQLGEASVNNGFSENTGTFVLDFEGLGDLDLPLDFYNGGLSDQGFSGPNFGISFNADAIALIDSDEGGSGNIANEPSPSTGFIFLGSDSTPILNLPAGFETGFSFFYCAINFASEVQVYDGLDGTGNLLGSAVLPITPSLGLGDPNGAFDNFQEVSIPFSGIAKSIVFGGAENQVVFDDITFGNIVAGCDAFAGSILFDDQSTQFEGCAGTGDLAAINVVEDGQPVGENTGWIITDAADGTILGLPTAPPFDLSAAPAGTCNIYKIAYENDLTGLMMQGNIANLDGCFDLSEPISVVRLEGDVCAPEPCTISNTTLVSTLCVGADNLLVTVSFDVTNGSGSYELIDVDTDTAIGTLTAAETATGLTIEGTVPRPTTAGTAINVKVVDTAVSSGTTELAVNGGFETGDFTGWSQFPSPSGSQTIDGSNPSEGNFAANVFNDEPASASVLKNANIGIGTVNPGDEITISFDIRGSGANGGVGFAEFFSEIDGGGVSSADLLGGAPLPLNADPNVWTPLSFTVTAGPDVSAGVSFQVVAVTGGVEGSQSNLFIDNLSITVEAESAQCMGDPIEVALPYTEVTFTGPGDQEVNSGELTGLGGGLPVGGVYSGTGVTDDGNGETYSFDTAFLDGGPVTITYSFTDANGCTYSASDEVGLLQSGPDNDLCADATLIACGDTISGSTADATFDDVGTCGTSNTANGVWYRFVGIDGEATISTCGTANFDTKISVFTGVCDDLTCVDGNDDGTGCADFTSELTIATTAGVEYYVLVHGFGTGSGDFDLSLICVDPCDGDTEAPEITMEAQNESVDCGSDDIEGAFEAWLANNGGAEATDANGVTWSNNACSENTFTVDEFANWIGFIARLDAGGGFIGGEPAPLSAITSEVGPGNQMTLQPSLSQPFDPNVTIEGITYVEDPSLVGQELTFTGNTLSNSLDSGYNAVAFIRIFTASFDFRDVVTMPLMAGESFSLTYDVATIPDAGIVQYGFIVSGPGALGADSGSLGTVVVEGVDTACVPFNNVCGESTEITFTATDACGQSSSTTATFSLEEPTPCTGDVVTVSITFDNFPEETSWAILDGDGLEVASGGPYGDEPDGSTFMEDICLEEGCYDFIIFDAFGDGICCSFGEGSYSVTDSNGAILASGGEFGSDETTNFCISGGCDVNAPSVWTGDIDSDWTNAANWLDSAAPGLSTNGEITIPMVSSNNYPVLTVGQDLYINECSTVTVESNASLTVNANVVVNNDGMVTNNGSVTFESDETGTAYIGSGSGMFVGDFTVERFIPAKRAYRQLSPAVTTSTPISDNWQQDTHITGPAGNTDGFDVTETGNPSAYIFDNVVYDYIQLANTNATNLIPGTMYHILVRGDRNTDLTNNNATPSITTLRATGELTADNNGSQTIAVNVPDQRFIAVGNPFQAQVDMNEVLTTDATNISPNFYWVWDPTLGERGAYTAILAADGTASVGDSDANQYLQAGQAGWVYTEAAGESSVSFTQSSKYIGMETDVFRNSSNVSSLGKLRLSLYESNALANNETAADGVLIMFDANGNNAVDANDALNITNLDENFAIDNNGDLLSIENRAQPQDQDEIQLEVNTYRNTNYTIVAEGIAMQDATAFLLDQYTGSLTEIPQTGSVSYTYTVDLNVTESVSGDRFKIVFEANSLSVGSQDLEDLLLYPNPNTGIFFINVPVGMDDLDVTIYSVLGVKVYNESGFSAGQNITIDTNRMLSPGSYLVELSSNGKTTTKKLIIN
ncbi:T9SS type A sorting domain-containing protein [Winogradskyella sp. DF17]|uniref:T9SS type A sorting domain-containing protein n=1 Tax=Winogradskyella pelagia TaxID=2819984 RepID=A0ABS3T4Z0_9FLAO|nr:T9SS type A sorting domain-containing protein [Winogradskyella sp. DF17]MBO3117810.1 T9SS type A sorting domain-containing protein [Winogradskyella sp. DF17]